MTTNNLNWVYDNILSILLIQDNKYAYRAKSKNGEYCLMVLISRKPLQSVTIDGKSSTANEYAEIINQLKSE